MRGVSARNSPCACPLLSQHPPLSFRPTLSCCSILLRSEGVPYIDKKLVDRDAWKGKQFGVAATRTGNHPKDFFDPTVKPLFEV